MSKRTSMREQLRTQQARLVAMDRALEDAHRATLAEVSTEALQSELRRRQPNTVTVTAANAYADSITIGGVVLRAERPRVVAVAGDGAVATALARLATFDTQTGQK